MNYLKPAGLIYVLLIFGSGQLMGQSKTDIREYGIKSQTVKELFIEEGMDEPVIELKEVYNEEGEIIELIEYNKEGDITKWEKYVYDEDGNVIEETVLNRRGRIEKREKTIYKDGLRIERQFFDSKDRMVKKKIYEYEFRK